MGNRIRNLRKEKGMTQEKLGHLLGVQRSAIRKYESGLVENIPQVSIRRMAEHFGVSPAYLLGYSDWREGEEPHCDYGFLLPKRRIPLLGEIACGKPILAADSGTGDMTVRTDIEADFCLRASGDSMIGARIFDGDIVFIREQPEVENGEIAAVLINDEATLKRVYYYPDRQKLLLTPENPKYEPLVFVGEELSEIRILGKAVAFQSSAL